jgi:hypothetical protein
VIASVDFEQERHSAEERSYILQLWQEAGKSLQALSDHEKVVLYNSLINYRNQLQTSTTMGYTR